MKNKEFNELLKKLHNELKNTPSINDKDRELLQTLMKDITMILNQPHEDKFIKHNNLIDQLNKAISHFEELHPTLVLSIKKVIETLSNMGI